MRPALALALASALVLTGCLDLYTPGGHRRGGYVAPWPPVASYAQGSTDHAPYNFSAGPSLTFYKVRTIADSRALDWSLGAKDPSVVALRDGRIRLYVSELVTRDRSVTRVAESPNGVDFRWIASPILDGFVEPRIVAIDGGFRAYARDERSFAIVSAVSVDGLNFTREPGERFNASWFNETAIPTPSIVRLPDGTWRAYVAPAYDPAKTTSAWSADGLLWLKDAGLRVGSGSATANTETTLHPAAVLDGSRVVLFFAGTCTATLANGDAKIGACYTLSNDGGVTFGDVHPSMTVLRSDRYRDTTLVPQEMAPLKLGDTWFLYYGTSVGGTWSAMVHLAIAEGRP